MQVPRIRPIFSDGKCVSISNGILALFYRLSKALLVPMKAQVLSKLTHAEETTNLAFVTSQEIVLISGHDQVLHFVI